MTQIIGAMTREYILVVSDRKLTHIDVNGRPTGQPNPKDACKLVNTSNIFCVGYTGLASLGGRPTHEWIAIQLAENVCSDAGVAAESIKYSGALALEKLSLIVRQEFLIGGWRLLADRKTLAPQLQVVTNAYNDDRSPKAVPDEKIQILCRGLRGDEDVVVHAVGREMGEDRQRQLSRYLGRLVKNEISPTAAMQALVDEILQTEKNSDFVGDKVLVCCLPKKAALRALQPGFNAFVAAVPNLDTATFCYFEPGGSGFRQFGPTFTHGGQALTDVSGTNDPATGAQSSSVKILWISTKARGPMPTRP